MVRHNSPRGALGSESGMALMELSVCVAVLVPLLVATLVLITSVHERNVVQLLPEALMREVGGGGLTWRSETLGDGVTLHDDRLRQQVNYLAEKALQDAHASTFKLKNISSRACCWIYEISEATGKARALHESFCIEKGALGNTLSLEAARSQKLGLGIAQPLLGGSPGEGARYLSRSILFGVAVGGELDGLGNLYPAERLQHASVWIPRRMMSL